MSQGIASAEGCLVGQVDAKSEAHYGRLLAPLLMREGTVFAWCSVHRVVFLETSTVPSQSTAQWTECSEMCSNGHLRFWALRTISFAFHHYIHQHWYEDLNICFICLRCPFLMGWRHVTSIFFGLLVSESPVILAKVLSPRSSPVIFVTGVRSSATHAWVHPLSGWCRWFCHMSWVMGCSL